MTGQPYFVVVKSQNVSHDYTEYVEEFTPSQEDLDAEGSGRDVTTGDMIRTRVAQKVNLTIKLATVTQAVANAIYTDIAGASSCQVKFQSPIANGAVTKEFYCSSVNFGAQRYDRSRQTCMYTGMTFKLIEV